MKKTLSGFLLLAFLSVGFQTPSSDTVEVEIVLTDGTEVTGYILALRDSSVVVSADATKEAKGIIVLPHRQVLSVQTAGSSHILVGLFSGLTVGCLTGMAIGGSQSVHNDCGSGGAALEKQANTISGGAIGSLVGSLVGLAVGAGVSHRSRLLISAAQRDFNVLKGVARYPDSEPEYLKTVAP